MKRKYEFNIEDINSTKIVDISNNLQYTRFFNRVPKTEQFIITYTALPKVKNRRTELVCSKCGKWSSFKDIHKHRNFVFECQHKDVCPHGDGKLIDESKLISIIKSYLDPEKFHMFKIYINDIIIE